MANPNIVAVSQIYGNNSLTSLTTTSETQIVNNAASSGKIYKINSIVVSNVDGTAAADVTVSIHDADDLAGNSYAIISTASVPADASLIVVDKSTGIYLKEDQSIGATASAANDLIVIASWEEIS